MRCEVAVIAGAVVEHRDLARLADLAEGFERAMDSRQRDMRMELAHRLEDGLDAGMIGGAEQRFDNREALRRQGESAFAGSDRRIPPSSGARKLRAGSR
jgi:hypothetical protein